MISSTVLCAQNVKKKWVDIPVECFMIKEKFGEEAEILTVDLRERERFVGVRERDSKWESVWVGVGVRVRVEEWQEERGIVGEWEMGEREWECERERESVCERESRRLK